LFQHSKDKRGYSNIQNSSEVIPPFTTPEGLFKHSKYQKLFQHSKHKRAYSNIQNIGEVISTFKTPQRLFQHLKHQRGYSYMLE
jgi:hypothetical protein